MNKSTYKRILTIQDISCVGQCSLTVALPIISACGIETAVLPSAVLSTHTGGFTGYTFRDLTEDLPAILAHWKKEGILFDGFYTGYLGSAKQIQYVRDILHAVGTAGNLKIVDPAMADNGKLYPGFDAHFVQAMKSLVADADFVLPNITEAALLTDSEYRDSYDESYIRDLATALGAKSVVLTGVGYAAEKTGVVVYKDGDLKYYSHRKIAGGFHGTGDIYASAFVGSLFRGKSAAEAAKIAADFTLKCIENTVGDDSHRYGVKFETVLPALVGNLYKIEDFR